MRPRERIRMLALGLLGVLAALALLRRGTPVPTPGSPEVDAPVPLAPDPPRAEPPAALDGFLGRPSLRAAPRAEDGPEELVWRVRGRVTDVAGRPVRDAEVVLAHVVPAPEDRAVVRARTRTGPDGSYRLTLGDGGRRAGDTFVSAAAPDAGALSHFPSLSVLPIDGTGAVVADLVLYPVGTVAVQVLDALGVPVPGSEVEVWARWPEGDTGTRAFPCDAEGRCTVAGLFGTIACRARAPGYRDDASHLGTVPVGGTLRRDLRLIRRSAGLRVRCVDPEGRPVPELAVAAGVPHDFEVGTAVVGTTDADGGVTLEGFAPDDLVGVRIGDAGDLWCPDPSVGDLAVGALEAAPVVTIPLLRGAKGRGIVRATTGERLGPGYPMSITARDVREDAETDASGRLVFERPIPVGPARIDAGAMPEGHDVEVTAGTCELDLVVEPCVRVEARLLQPDGAPLRGRWPPDAVRIGLSLALEAEPGGPSQVYALEGERGAHRLLGTWAPAAFARRSRVVLRTVGPSPRVLALSPRIGPVRTGSTVHVDLVVPPDALPRLRGHVLLPGSPTPCVSASLQLVPLDVSRVGGTRYAFLWGTDRFELAFVRPGRYDLILSAADGAVRRTITVPETGLLDLGDLELGRR